MRVNWVERVALHGAGVEDVIQITNVPNWMWWQDDRQVPENGDGPPMNASELRLRQAMAAGAAQLRRTHSSDTVNRMIDQVFDDALAGQAQGLAKWTRLKASEFRKEQMATRFNRSEETITPEEMASMQHRPGV